MNKEINIEYTLSKELEAKIDPELKLADEAYKTLMDGDLDMTDWIHYPLEMSDDLLAQIKNMANTIKSNFSAVVIIGIGGSYLGAQAALDFIPENKKGKTPEIHFAGINMSTDYYEKILKKVVDKDFALIIISKSGSTMETVTGSEIFMRLIESKYGKEGKKNRIFAVTDPENGKLRNTVNEEGYPSLPLPSGIGGRFSVLTSVGFLPMAIAGIDIDEVIEGARAAAQADLISKAKKLAAVRNAYEDTGYSVEIFANFDPYTTNLIQWLKQLYGESEGKSGKGLLPVNLEYSKDLHSLGQFVQEGRQIFAETIIDVKDEAGTEPINIPKSLGLAGDDLTMRDLNQAAKKGVMTAHSEAGVPVMEIVIPRRDAYSLGQAFYFFQMTCAIRGLMMGINPFDQPGVEQYKHEMRKNLK